jgi:hypothetical protein
MFFFGFAFTKVVKTTKQNKTNFFTNTKKQIGSNNEEKNSSIKGQEKRGSRSSPFAEAWRWHPLVPKSNKKKKRKKKRSSSSPFVGTWQWRHWYLEATKNEKHRAQAPPMLRLCDGIHLHQKQPKKQKKGGTKVTHLSILGDGAYLHQKKKKKTLPRLGDGAHLRLEEEKTKKWKKRGSSSFLSTKTWPWCPRSNKTNEKRGSQLPFCQILAMAS